MKELEDNVGNVVYLMGHTLEQSTYSQSSLEVFTKESDVDTYLSAIPAVDLGEVTLLHGVVSRAISIPNVIGESVDIILVIPEANSEKDSYIKKFANLNALMEFIELLTREDGEGYDDDNIPEDVVEDLMDIDPQEIENLFVLYGYEICLVYTYDKEDKDDAIIADAKLAFKDIRKFQ